MNDGYPSNIYSFSSARGYASVCVLFAYFFKTVISGADILFFR